MSDIEWTEKTWNPVTGCTKVSPGCKYCYAETMAQRLQAMGIEGYKDGFTTVTCLPQRLNDPLKRKKPTMYFVNSMSDLFHEHIPFDFIDKVMETIRRTPQHTYQILTKRPERMAEFFNRDQWLPMNAWLGTSVEDKKYGVPRIDILRNILYPTIKFLSIEPLLEDIGQINLRGIHWVIVGGESGKKARPMEHAWVESISRQCELAHVPFFFKQWGAWKDGVKRSKKANGRIFNDKTWNALPYIKTITT